jgi:hypothetical protein
MRSTDFSNESQDSVHLNTYAGAPITNVFQIRPAVEIDMTCPVSNLTTMAARPTISFPERHPDKRLGELMLYIAKKSQFDQNFGGTKLNKILFYADFVSYGRSGKPITGAEYIKQEFGPTPKRLLPVRKQLESKKEAAVQRIDFLGKEQQRLVALRDPDLSLFSGEEIALVDQVIEYLKGKSAKEMSELSHNRAWRVAKMNGSIPYEAAFISDENPNERDVERGRELVEQHGWAV